MQLLLVEDSNVDASFLRACLKQDKALNFEVHRVCTLAEAQALLSEPDTWDIVLLDLNLPDSEGLETFERLQSINSEVPIVVLSGHDDEQMALAAVNRGVQDYLVKWEGGGKLIVRSIRYAIERKRTERHLQYLAQYDPLTGVGNRQYFTDQIFKAAARARRVGSQLALLFLDLDHFKNVNDAMGHDVGDRLLKRVAHRLQSCLRLGDFIARIGGDEFAVLVENVEDLDDLRALASKLLAQIAEPFELDGRPYFATGSIGITVFPQDGNDPALLLKNADIAMYAAKARGRNQYCFITRSMQEELILRHELNADLRRALKDEQFLLYYQPKFNAETNTVIGMEALIRWQHPDRGLLTPADFILAAEDTGLIVSLGHWCLEAVCKQIQSWRGQGYEVPPIAVNVSAQQFHRPHFLPDLERLLHRYSVEPALIELELTEGMLMQDTAVAQKTLAGLHKIGVRLAIDDFGTGYSSLNYLARFPLDVLKIDRSFVTELPTDTSMIQITKAIISLAENLDMEIIAEGVENRAQAQFLLDNGCHQQQGFLFGRPAPPKDLRRYFSKAAESPRDTNVA